MYFSSRRHSSDSIPQSVESTGASGPAVRPHLPLSPCISNHLSRDHRGQGEEIMIMPGARIKIATALVVGCISIGALAGPGDWRPPFSADRDPACPPTGLSYSWDQPTALTSMTR